MPREKNYFLLFFYFLGGCGEGLGMGKGKGKGEKGYLVELDRVRAGDQ